MRLVTELVHREDKLGDRFPPVVVEHVCDAYTQMSPDAQRTFFSNLYRDFGVSLETVERHVRHFEAAVKLVLFHSLASFCFIPQPPLSRC